jgi:hypothetical protein
MLSGTRTEGGEGEFGVQTFSDKSRILIYYRIRDFPLMFCLQVNAKLRDKLGAGRLPANDDRLPDLIP